MTEKRFTYDKPLVAFSKGGINDKVTGETYEFTMDTVLDLLNELHEENEQLKQSNKELLLLVDTLKEQNMKFKTRLNDLGVEYYD